MTSAQTLSTHSSFNTKQKSSLLSEDSEHEYSTSKPISELETLTKFVSQTNLRNSSASRMSLRSREQLDQGSLKGSMVPTSENSRKSETSPQASSENPLQAKNKLFPSKLAAKLDKMPEENILDKSPGANDLPRPRKNSEDNFTYNTRKHNKAVEQPMEIEDSKPQNDKKITPTDSVSSQQIGGYHLRSTGPKSGNRDSGFSDDFEYEYPGKNPSSSEGGVVNYSSSRSKTSRGTASTNLDNLGQTNQEPATQKTGSGQKNSVTRRTRQPNIQNMICEEDISQMDLSGDPQEKRRTTERITRFKRDMDKVSLECTEELEDPRSNDPIENNLKSPQGSRADNNRKRGGKKCLNKLCLTNPNMPSLWAREKVKGSAICKPCLEAFNKDQFCYFCHQIYVDDETTTAADDKDWIGCDSCGGWHHIQCEDAYGSKIISQHAKYYCPKCRPNKGSVRSNKISMSLLEIPTTTSRGNNSPRNSRPSTPKKGQNAGKNANQRPPLDDWLVCEEGLEEPSVIKMRFNNDRRGTNVEVSAASGEDDQVIEEEEEDIVKKKLDSLFRKTGGRRRNIQFKPQVNIESYSELDKLMTNFGGKRTQLTEQEIKSDLTKIKELTKGLIGLQLMSEASGSEMCATEGDMTEETESIAETPVLKNNRSSRNSRGGATSKPKERISQILAKEEKSARQPKQGSKAPSQEISMGSDGLPKMQLRRR